MSTKISGHLQNLKNIAIALCVRSSLDFNRCVCDASRKLLESVRDSQAEEAWGRFGRVVEDC